ncbi:MAG: ABC transporter ATP-binding protein [Oscillospiraceae bacterium]|jgi:branched-chain amino acid transport system ATP-binding protein|nr:ABC transporter ATP-binding protein [Oscillospiraceae bacterium]
MKLEIRDLKVSYGGIKALKGISLTVDEGSIVTLIGANGAGKSTTLRAVSGLTRVESGSITLDDKSLVGLPTKEIVRSGIVMVPEGRRVFPDMTVRENLLIGAYTRKDSGVEHDMKHVFDLFPRLSERTWQLAGTLSGGEQQMLAVGRALMTKPKLLMMDEPSLGLAPLVVRDIFEIIKRVNEDGITVLLIEQNANAALRVAGYGYVLETGAIVLEDTGASLMQNPRVQEAYLGKKKGPSAKVVSHKRKSDTPVELLAD